MYQLVNAGDGMCLTEPSGGAQLGGAACDGAVGQTWQLTESGEGFGVKPASGGLCVGVLGASAADGMAVQQRACGDGSSQVWKTTEVGETYHLVDQRYRNGDKKRGGEPGQPPVLLLHITRRPRDTGQPHDHAPAEPEHGIRRAGGLDPLDWKIRATGETAPRSVDVRMR
jgi:hypothetical protein